MCCAAHLEIALFQRYLAHVPLARDHFQQRLASGGADWIAVHCKLPQLGGLLVSMLTLHFDSLRFASLHFTFLHLPPCSASANQPRIYYLAL